MAWDRRVLSCVRWQRYGNTLRNPRLGLTFWHRDAENRRTGGFLSISARFSRRGRGGWTQASNQLNQRHVHPLNASEQAVFGTDIVSGDRCRIAGTGEQPALRPHLEVWVGGRRRRPMVGCSVWSCCVRAVSSRPSPTRWHSPIARYRYLVDAHSNPSAQSESPTAVSHVWAGPAMIQPWNQNRRPRITRVLPLLSSPGS